MITFTDELRVPRLNHGRTMSIPGSGKYPADIFS